LEEMEYVFPDSLSNVHIFLSSPYFPSVFSQTFSHSHYYLHFPSDDCEHDSVPAPSDVLADSPILEVNSSTPSNDFGLTDSLEQFLKENEEFVQCVSENCHFVFERTPNPQIAVGVTVCVFLNRFLHIFSNSLG
jgi:hypothetical protein